MDNPPAPFPFSFKIVFLVFIFAVEKSAVNLTELSL